MREDQEIIALYWQRDETAIRETQQKYGAYLSRIAYQILACREDSEESVNDTYLRAWESMPPHRPQRLSTYLGKLTRRLSIDIFRRKNRQKRQGSEYAQSLCELEGCLAGGSADEEVDLRLLGECIGRYLQGLAADRRAVFLERYYFMDPVRGIAASHGMRESAVKSLLYRTRQGLRQHLEEEGFSI